MHFNEDKSYCVSVLILLLMLLEKIPKNLFLKAGGLCKSIVAPRGGQHVCWLGSEFLTFFADIIHE